MDKDIIYQKKILSLLVNGKQTSVKKVAECVGLSEKMIRIKLEKLEIFLQDKKLGEIIKIPGKGINLKIANGREDELLKYVNQNISIDLNDSEYERKILFYVLSLNSKGSITQNKLSELLYISVPTLKKKLDRVEQFLSEYQLTLKAVQRKGVWIEGNMVDKRTAIKDFILSGNTSVDILLEPFTPGLNIAQIKQIIKDVEKNWKIKFSKESLDAIWIVICLSIYRGKYRVESYELPDFSIEEYNEYNFAESIYESLTQNGYVNHNCTDIKLLAIEILTANKLETFSYPKNLQSKFAFDCKLEEFVKRLIISISEILSEDLSNDKLLQKELEEHLKSAIFRLKFGQKYISNVSKQLKIEYKRVFLSVWATSQLFEEYYSVQITENEIAYIALYIESSLLRKKNKVEAVLITDLGKSQSLFIVDTLKRDILQLGEIQIIRKEEIEIKDLQNKIVLSTVAEVIENEIHISTIPTRSDINEIKKIIENKGTKKTSVFNFSQKIQPLFDPEFIFMDVVIEDKNQLLKMMTKKIEGKGLVTERFYNTLWKRECKTTTCIGNYTSIPHGSTTEVNEYKILIASLKKPIKWYGEEYVDLVFLLATKMKTSLDIERTKQFYIDLIDFTENKYVVNNFKVIKNGIDAYHYLFSY